MLGRRRILMVVGTAVLLAACGGTSRSDFDAEIDSRGGGLGADLPVDMVAALREEVGAGLVLRSMTVHRARATAEVLVPGTQDQLDSYSFGTSGLYGGDGLSGPTPVTGVADAGALRPMLFRPGRLALEDLDELVDAAIVEADLAGGYGQSISIRRSGPRTRISISVTSPRDSVSVDYFGNGEPVGGPLR